MSTEQIKERLEERKRAIEVALEVVNEIQERPSSAPEEVHPATVQTVAEAAREVLGEAQPMKTKPLAAAIQRRGFATRSKNFYPVVYKAMRTHKEFEKTPQGWVLSKAS